MTHPETSIDAHRLSVNRLAMTGGIGGAAIGLFCNVLGPRAA